MIADELAAAVAKRRGLGLPNPDTNAYRLVHGESDGVDGLTVDVYDRFLVASLYTETFGTRERGWIAALAELGYEGVYVKQRPRQANELSAEQRRSRAPEQAIAGRDAPSALIVHEHGVPFEVQLGEGLSTGLFLDQRDNRARVEREAAGKRVLNLFAYTCAFGAVAARGGAQRTVNIDVAKPALDRGRRNYALSSIPLDLEAQAGVRERNHVEAQAGVRERNDARVHASHVFLARDVFEALPRLAKRGEQFELVVLDPPSYATTKRGRFQAERDYPEIVVAALRVLAEGGALLACTNQQKLTIGQFVHTLRLAERASSRPIRELEILPPPADHSALPGRAPHLKSVWIRI